MQINPINFTGNVTVLSGAKKHSDEKDLEQIKQISDYEDIDYYIYSVKKHGKEREYQAVAPVGDTLNLKKFNFYNNILFSAETSDLKPAFSIQQALCKKDKPNTLKIECDKDHGELLIGQRDSTYCIVYSKHDLNFRLGGYLGEKYTGILFSKQDDGKLTEFNFDDGKLTAKKIFDQKGNLVHESEFKYNTKGALTASLNGKIEENNFNVLLPYNQSDAMFALISSQLIQEN